MSGAHDAAALLAALFPRLADEEHIEIRPLDGRGGVGPRRWFTDPHAAAAYALALAPRWDVYFGVNPRRQGGGKKAHVTSVRVLHADADDKCFLAGRAGALAALAGFPLAPSLTVDSGGGLQAYWLLTAPTTDVPGVEGLLSRLYARLGGLDSVQDASRVLRVPGTTNHTYTPRRPVALLECHPARRYTPDEFAALLPAPPAPPRPAAPPVGPRRDGIPPPEAIRELLRHIPPQGDYRDDWLRVLAAVHSVYPGPEGVALCEEWSRGRPGEIERKFASFGCYRGERGPATLGTLYFLAQRHGWRPTGRARLVLVPRAVDRRPAARLTPEGVGHAR